MARLVVIMGVAGSGKTTIATALAARHGWAFLEGDGFHPAHNLALMRTGRPLDDRDRRDWITAIRRAIDRLTDNTVVLACSALNVRVRDWLSIGLKRDVVWCWLEIDEPTAASRVDQREGHYMPVSLVRSQFDALEPPRHAIRLDASQAIEPLLDELSAKLNSPAETSPS